MATGTPRRRAAVTKRYPDPTISDDPRTSSAADRVQQRERSREPRRRDVLAEEDHVRLEDPPAPATVDHDEPACRSLVERQVTVGPRGTDPLGIGAEPRVDGVETQSELQAGPTCPTPEADDRGEPTVEVDHVLGPGCGVQTVDVLRHDPGEEPRPLQRRHREVGRVGTRGRDPGPAEVAAGPVAPPLRGAAAEGVVGHDRGVAWSAVRVPVVGDPGAGRHAGTGEDQDPATTDEGDERVEDGSVVLVDRGRHDGRVRTPASAAAAPSPGGRRRPTGREAMVQGGS
jgi:hypothetical protein